MSWYVTLHEVVRTDTHRSVDGAGEAAFAEGPPTTTGLKYGHDVITTYALKQ